MNGIVDTTSSSQYFVTVVEGSSTAFRAVNVPIRRNAGRESAKIDTHLCTEVWHTLSPSYISHSKAL
jgi:hypothetical protein